MTMQVETPNPNLATPETFRYKEILVRKLVRAVACSVFSQILILLIYIIIANVNILNPVEWVSSILKTFTRLSTYIFIIIFSFIIFAQCLICAKDYVLMSYYCPTRFKKFLHVFSLHNFILLSLHVIIGGAFTWQILVIIDSSNKSLTTICKEHQSCLVQDTFFLIINGFWTGFYFFVTVYVSSEVSSKQLEFPVIQQKKFLQFRSNITILFKESLKASILSIIFFVGFYYFWGDHLESQFRYIVILGRAPRESSILIYLYLWWFSALYIFSMNLMRFFFHMYLTEPVQFPIMKENIYVPTLAEALVMSNVPIVQKLACLDLCLMSQWSAVRRQLFFTLSQPGGHPHNWNALVESVMKLFTEYIELLERSTEVYLSNDLEQKQVEPITSRSPLGLQSPQDKPRNLRDMINPSMRFLIQNEPVNTSIIKTVEKYMNPFISKIVSWAKMLLGINFLFGKLPQVNIQKCLGNGQLIIWASEGITELTTASLTEDNYGIVQKDLPVIITTLVHLKQNLDKLNVVPELPRKDNARDDFNYRMKSAIVAAVKHSLFNISRNFGEYLNDFPLNKDVVQYLQNKNNYS